MRYQGGKAKVASGIARVILHHRGDRETYLEPFLGVASVFARVAPHFRTILAGDLHPDLILLWRAVRMGWVPPSRITEAQYHALRDAEPSALRGFAGFACSFGGTWFGTWAVDDRPAVPVNFALQAKRQVMGKQTVMRRAEVRSCDYRDWDDRVGPDVVVYADPPYQQTAGFSTGEFDSGEFWNVMREWSARGAMVLVSEYAAPDDWREVWSQRVQVTFSVQNTYGVERLFIPGGPHVR